MKCVYHHFALVLLLDVQPNMTQATNRVVFDYITLNNAYITLNVRNDPTNQIGIHHVAPSLLLVYSLSPEPVFTYPKDGFRHVWSPVPAQILHPALHHISPTAWIKPPISPPTLKWSPITRAWNGFLLYCMSGTRPTDIFHVEYINDILFIKLENGFRRRPGH